MFDIKSLADRVGLEVGFVRRVVKAINPLLAPHMTRGDSNALLFDSSALPIFERVSQLKKDGLILPEIEKRLASDFANPSSQDSKPSETPSKSSQSEEGRGVPIDSLLARDLFETNRQLQRQLLEEKEARRRESEEKAVRILELAQQNATFQTALKLLPEGKSPEQVRADWEAERDRKLERGRIIIELRSLGSFSFRKRKRLLARLEELEGPAGERTEGR